MKHKLETLELPFPASPEALFAPFANHPWSIWLDSSTQQSGTHIMTARPAATLEHWPDKTLIQYANGKTTTCYPTDKTDLLASIRAIEKELYGHLLNEYLPNEYLEEPHGHGLQNTHGLSMLPGALGFFSYEQGVAWQNLTVNKDDIDFPLVALGFYTWVLSINCEQQRCTLTFDPTHHTENELLTLLDTNTNTNTTEPLLTSTSHVTENLSYQAYHHAFNQVQQHLLAGDCYQINLAKRLSANVSGSSWHQYLNIRQNHPNPFSAFACYPFGDILCFSPEEFLHIDSERQVTTRPIKGTLERTQRHNAAHDADEVAQLKRSAKNRAENLMIVDLMRNDLSQVCLPNTVQVPKLFDIETFPTVHHMVSTVVGTLKPNLDAWDLLKACSPGGSITGAPKHQAMKIIQSLEPNNRHIFCGSLIHKDILGGLKSNLCIRTLLRQQDHLYAWVGSGIVIDSNAEEEQAELDWKIGKIIDLIRGQQTK